MFKSLLPRVAKALAVAQGRVEIKYKLLDSLRLTSFVTQKNKYFEEREMDENKNECGAVLEGVVVEISGKKYVIATLEKFLLHLQGRTSTPEDRFLLGWLTKIRVMAKAKEFYLIPANEE